MRHRGERAGKVFSALPVFLSSFLFLFRFSPAGKRRGWGLRDDRRFSDPAAPPSSWEESCVLPALLCYDYISCRVRARWTCACIICSPPHTRLSRNTLQCGRRKVCSLRRDVRRKPGMPEVGGSRSGFRVTRERFSRAYTAVLIQSVNFVEIEVAERKKCA